MKPEFLYHTGFEIIRTPDIKIGRKNADFGQGFYLSKDEDFSRRWARERRGSETFLNTYRLDPDGLKIKRFERDEEWFSYIFANRSGAADTLADFDVIAGPIANDTIYDTLGIITSGFLSREQSLQLLLIGPAYEQTVIKTEKAAAALHFESAVRLSPGEIAGLRDMVKHEEEAYQEQFARKLEELTGAS